MDKKQSLAFLLSAMMVATPFSAFAAEDGTAHADADASAKAATEQSVENNQAKGKASVQEDAQLEGLHFFLGDGFFARGIDRNLIRVKK